MSYRVNQALGAPSLMVTHAALFNQLNPGLWNTSMYSNALITLPVTDSSGTHSLLYYSHPSFTGPDPRPTESPLTWEDFGSSHFQHSFVTKQKQRSTFWLLFLLLLLDVCMFFPTQAALFAFPHPGLCISSLVVSSQLMLPASSDTWCSLWSA